MKVLLIDPPCYRFMGFYRHYFPLGLTYVAAVLRKAGHDVLVYDADHDPCAQSKTFIQVSDGVQEYRKALTDDFHPIWEEFRNIISVFSPDVVGVSVLTSKVASAKKIVKLARECVGRDFVAIAGGDHATVRPQDLLLDGTFDFVVRGEGEYIVKELLEYLSGDKVLGQIPGLSWMADGKMQSTFSAPLIRPLDNLPMPALDLLYGQETYRSLDFGLLITERGCPSKCTFCGLQTIWEDKVRFHSIDRVIEEIVHRRDTYGTKYFSFRNGTFTLSKKRMQELCSRLVKEDIQWECLTRVDCIDIELLQLMRDAGCVTIRVGVESGSQELLDYMKKGITCQQVIDAAQLLNESGIFWTAYFMMGVPKENEKSVFETISMMRSMNPPFITLSKFSPLPGTLMYQEVVDAGLIDEDTTDWTWSLNQDMNSFFVTEISSEKMQELMLEAARFVDQHNQVASSRFADRRAKY